MPGPYDPRIFCHTSLDMVTDCVFPAHLIDLSSKNVLWISVQTGGLDGMGDADRDQWIAETKCCVDRANGEDKAVSEA